MAEELHGQMIMEGVSEIIQQAQAAKYQSFVEKFNEPKTTDDCYTPPEIYDGIADWVAEEYRIPRERFLRPFRPGGDYQAEEYPEGYAVVDNPPFSILASIVDWYLARNVPFFLFGPTLTICGILRREHRKAKCCIILIGNQITYENGAVVQTSYVTNMEPTYNIRIEGGLREKMEAINDRLKKEKTAQLPKYEYPAEVITGKDYRIAKYGQTLRIRREDCAFVSELDAQRIVKKQIFGSGFLLSARATAERIEAEKRADAEAMKEKQEEQPQRWALSPRELDIIARLGGATE